MVSGYALEAEGEHSSELPNELLNEHTFIGRILDTAKLGM